MSEGNGDGVIRIGRKGKKKIALGDGEPRDLDIVDVSNRWSEIDRSFRDADFKIPSERIAEANEAAYAFVMGIFEDASITRAEALEFLKIITEEAAKLSDFFTVKSGSVEPSSQESTTTLRFST